MDDVLLYVTQVAPYGTDPVTGARRLARAHGVLQQSAIALVEMADRALYLAKPVCVPIALAILFAFLLTPIVSLLERTILRRTGAIVLSLGLIVTGIGFGGWWLYH